MNLLKGYFTVPSSVSDERVESKKQEFIKKYADSFDKEGWKLISPVAFAKSLPLAEDIKQGRSRWTIMAYWERKPVEQTFEVDEKLIPKLLKTGKFSLK